MTAPQKICPQCQTPAPLDAAFCRQCGRQYRTQFAADGIPVTPLTPAAPPPVDFPAKPPLVMSRRMTQALVVLGTLVVFLSVLAIRSRMQQSSAPAIPVRHSDTSDLPQPPPFAAPQVSSMANSDPVNEEAKRFIERESQEHGLEPPAGSVGSDGRIHLRSGGSITREEWESARRSVQQSQANPPIPAPPMP